MSVGKLGAEVIRMKDARTLRVGTLARTTMFVPVLAIAWFCLSVGAPTAAAKRTKPVIQILKSPPPVSASAGTVVLTASVSGAKECMLTANKAVAGLPAQLSCEGGSVGSRLVVPANSRKKAARYKLTLTDAQIDQVIAFVKTLERPLTRLAVSRPGQ